MIVRFSFSAALTAAALALAYLPGSMRVALRRGRRSDLEPPRIDSLRSGLVTLRNSDD
jgi:hypothetical protein